MINFGKFEAQPKTFAGRPMRGVESLPGFHTSSNPVVAYTYAQAKIDTKNIHLNYKINDYPIIITLDMSRLEPLLDYDTDITCRKNYKNELFYYFLHDRIPSSNKGVMLARLKDYLLGCYKKQKPSSENLAELHYIYPGSDSIDWLFVYHMKDWFDYPCVALMELIKKSPYSLDSFLEKLLNNNLQFSDEELMSLTKQYRYIADIEEERIMEIDYIKPLYNHIIINKIDPWDIVDYDVDFVKNLENNNFEYILEKSKEPEWTIVYSWKNPKQHKSPRIEYHGTTYCNLIAAAPKLAKQLPIPPKPFVL